MKLHETVNKCYVKSVDLKQFLIFTKNCLNLQNLRRISEESPKVSTQNKNFIAGITFTVRDIGSFHMKKLTPQRRDAKWNKHTTKNLTCRVVIVVSVIANRP